MPRDGALTLSDARDPALSIVCAAEGADRVDGGGGRGDAVSLSHSR